MLKKSTARLLILNLKQYAQHFSIILISNQESDFLSSEGFINVGKIQAL
jgi:hypothetical protein